MDFIIDHWLPILVATVAMFFMSFLIWAVLPHHTADWKRRLPNEDSILAAMRDPVPEPGQYMLPHCPDQRELAKEEMQAKWEQGPAGFLYVLPRGLPKMGRRMGCQLTYQLMVNVFIGYIASLTIPHGAGFMDVFRVVGAVAVLGHAAGFIPNAIWFGRPFASAAKEVLDGIAYGVVTGLIFAALW